MQLNLCPNCAKPLGPEVSPCRTCKQPVPEPLSMDLFAFGETPRKRCPSCGRSMPEFAACCGECLHTLDPGQAALPLLPPGHQLMLDGRSYEDSVLLAVMRDGDRPVEADQVKRLLEQSQVQLFDVRTPEYPENAGATWELELWVALPDEQVLEGGYITRDGGVAETRGERIQVWLEMGAPATLPASLTEPARLVAQAASWTLGVTGHFTQTPVRRMQLHLAVLQVLARADAVMVDLFAGRILDDRIQERLRGPSPDLSDLYAIREWRIGSTLWLHTQGLARLGCYELEVFLVPARRQAEVEALMHRAAATLVNGELPGPDRAFPIDGDLQAIWSPYALCQGRLPGGIPGRSSEQRAALIHPSAVLFSVAQDGDKAPLVEALGVRAERGLVSEGARSSAGAPASSTGAAPVAGAPSPVVAALLSFLLPGAGHLYGGQALKGMVLFGLVILTCGLGGLLNLLIIADAWVMASKKQRGEVVGDWSVF